MLSRLLARKLSRPLSRPLTRPAGGPSLDPDAAAYIAALVSGGATVSSVQSSAIDTFIRAEKIALRWDLIKRLYLPIWGLAAPNAICMRSLTSGTFVGGVTHSAGFVQGNGTTGYFDTGVSAASLDITVSSAYIFALMAEATPAETTHEMGAIDDPGRFTLLSLGTLNRIRSQFGSVGAEALLSVVPKGIASGGIADGVQFSSKRTQSERKTTSAARTNSGGLPNINTYALARNTPSGANQLSPVKTGAYGFGLGINQSADEPFTLNLKTLWETANELTLP